MYNMKILHTWLFDMEQIYRRYLVMMANMFVSISLFLCVPICVCWCVYVSWSVRPDQNLRCLPICVSWCVYVSWSVCPDLRVWFCVFLDIIWSFNEVCFSTLFMKLSNHLWLTSCGSLPSASTEKTKKSSEFPIWSNWAGFSLCQIGINWTLNLICTRCHSSLFSRCLSCIHLAYDQKIIFLD